MRTAGAVLKGKLAKGCFERNSDMIKIGDMFQMQMLMNHLSQLSEKATSAVSAANSAISSMAGNAKK